MKIGIIGAGNIGALLATKLGAAGHDVAIANSRGPETIDPGILTEGVRAAEAADAITGAEVVIVSVPFAKIPALAGLLSQIPETVPLIDTGNYYPGGTVGMTRSTRVRSKASGSRRPSAARSPKPGTRSGPLPWPTKGTEPGRRDASLYPSPRIGTRIAGWPWTSSSRPVSTPSTPAGSRSRGVSSPARPCTAPTSPVRR